ncbi:hypothetical protein PENSPDRAFT_118828 [Peniophora sp. CONT]|nr:hypothetical protein PENSPDRAFT_118828 [Peniophora sp. CONT]
MRFNAWHVLTGVRVFSSTSSPPSSLLTPPSASAWVGVEAPRSLLAGNGRSRLLEAAYALRPRRARQAFARVTWVCSI